MPGGFNPQEDDDPDKLAFQEWKKKWNKFYPTPDEDNAKFKNFKQSLIDALDPAPAPKNVPLWTVLNEFADLTIEEHHGYLRLDLSMIDDDLDFDLDEYPDRPHVYCTVVVQEDGTRVFQRFYPPRLGIDIEKFVQEEIQRQRTEIEDTKVKPQSTVPPVKRTSDDKDDTNEEDTVKRQKIGCGGQKQGCCSDCGK